MSSATGQQCHWWCAFCQEEVPSNRVTYFEKHEDCGNGVVWNEQRNKGEDFKKELQATINRYSKENGSNTPDFILAQFLAQCLTAWDEAVKDREKWYGREPKPLPVNEWPQTPPPQNPS